MSLFKNPLLIILLVLTSFVSFGQDEIVSYSYSGATEAFGSNSNSGGRRSIFRYATCKDFSLSVEFAVDREYQVNWYDGEVISSYDSETKTMEIIYSPYDVKICDSIEIGLSIYVEDSTGRTDYFKAIGWFDRDSVAVADSIWFLDDGDIIRGDTIESCEIFGNAFQFGTKINDERFSGELFDNFFTGNLREYCWEEDFKFFVNGVNRSDDFNFWSLRDKYSLTDIELKTGDVIEIVKNFNAFKGKSILSEKYCRLDIAGGTSTGKKNIEGIT